MMNREGLGRLCAAILDRLRHNQEVRYDQSRQLMEHACDIIRSGNYRNLPQSFYSLLNFLKSGMQYGHTAGMKPEDAATFGMLWCAAGMVEWELRQKEEATGIREAARRYIKYRKVFFIMRKNPGITHQNLAALSGTTVSMLSQLMARLDGQRFFSYSNAGREKFYYLSDRGEELLREMKRSEAAAQKQHDNAAGVKLEKLNKPDDDVSAGKEKEFGLIGQDDLKTAVATAWWASDDQSRVPQSYDKNDFSLPAVGTWLCRYTSVNDALLLLRDNRVENFKMNKAVIASIQPLPDLLSVSRMPNMEGDQSWASMKEWIKTTKEKVLV